MKITRILTHHLEAPLSQRFGWSLGWTSTRHASIVEVQTDAGLTGWGEGLAGANPQAAIGRSPYELAGIFEESRPPSTWQRRRGAPAGAGLDIALWDLIGKSLGRPVCEILGHVHRTRVEAYCTALYRKDWPDLATGLADEARSWVDKGYRRLKMKIGYDPNTDFHIVAAVRKAIGPNIALGVDSNCAYDAATAIGLAHRLEQFDLMWWEEPLLADDLDGYSRLRDATSIPVAAGETESADWLLTNYVQPRRVDILQPDLVWTGLTGFRQLSHACWLNRIRLVPHNWGTAIRTAATLHAMATCPPLTESLAPPPLLFEFDRTESPFRDAVIAQCLAIDSDSCVPVPAGPGLGVKVLREAVASFRVALEEVGD
jgi:D-galactarolactone cycloisomerase